MVRNEQLPPYGHPSPLRNKLNDHSNAVTEASAARLKSSSNQPSSITSTLLNASGASGDLDDLFINAARVSYTISSIDG